MGFGLHPDQLIKDGEHTGFRGTVRSYLRILATDEEEPSLYSWVLKFPDSIVRGRQWVVEVGLKRFQNDLELSCIVKTDDYSTLVESPVTASQPRLIRYVVSNIQQEAEASFGVSVPGVAVKTVGLDADTYEALLAEVERHDRNGPIVLVSPTKDGEYLLNVTDLQSRLFGLAQVVQVCREFNSYEMAEVLGQSRSAWGGAVNILFTPNLTGFVRGRLILADEIAGWGDTQNARISHILAWVTGNTNIPRLHRHIRPEGVVQLAIRRRMQTARALSAQMDESQLRLELEESAKREVEQTKYFNELVEENSRLEDSLSTYKSAYEEAQETSSKKDYTIESLKNQLQLAGGGASTTIEIDLLMKLLARAEAPTPRECLDVIAQAYADRCIILPSDFSSADKAKGFVLGRQLLDLLRRLVTDYRSSLIAGGDNEARKVFGKGEYAAKESETVMKSKSMRRQRVFLHEGEELEMFRHLKIGVGDDVTKTIRVHFYWQADRETIVIGYCGEHLTIISH